MILTKTYKSITIVLIFSLFLTICNGQTTTISYSKTVKEQAERMGQLLLKKDFRSFSDYTYPRIIDMMGGKQKMIEAMEKGAKEMQSAGTAFLSIKIGNPSKLIATGKEYQCTLPQTIEMKVPNGRLVTQSTLIAISTDKGKKWYFVDSGGKDIITMKKVLPNLSGELIIPEKTQPKFYTE